MINASARVRKAKTFFKFDTDLKKRRLVGVILALILLGLFLAFNRIPKLDTIEADLAIATSPGAECFQGFCISQDDDSTLMERWWKFSLTYLNLVWMGMAFAFVMAGLTESFLFPADTRERFTGRGFKGVLKGVVIGPAVNLCSACIVPIATAFRRRGAGIETTVAITQGSSTMNLPALIMVTLVFIPIIGGSRIALSILGALLLGPLVAYVAGRGVDSNESEDSISNVEIPVEVSWKDSLSTASLQFVRSTVKQTLRLGPIMVIAGFASGLAIQWISPDTITAWIGDDIVGIIVASSLGIAVNVPLLFEIPLVAAMLLAGMGTAPAGALLFTAAAGGPITFWGLAKVMPKRGVVTLGMSTWGLGIIGGIVVLAITAITEPGRDFSFKSDYTSTSLARIYPTQQQIENAEHSLVINQSNSQDNIPLFEDVAEAAQLDFKHTFHIGEFTQMGGGAIVSDFDSDGLDDIYIVNSHGPNSLFKNQGDVKFQDIGVETNSDDTKAWGNGGCAADFDNDGYRDLYVSNYGDSKLLRNSGNTGFQDITYQSGMGEEDPSYRAMGCAWGDYDRDGLLDLIVVRYFHEWKPGILDALDFKDAIRPLALYHNLGEARFENVTNLLGALTLPKGFRNGRHPGSVWGAGFQPVWADFDDDGDLDLYVANDFGFAIQPNVMWRNDGPGEGKSWEFRDISSSTGADLPMSGMGIAVGDYDVDGDIDMYITNIGVNVFLRNESDGIYFSNITPTIGAEVPNVGVNLRVAWGAMFLDYDNDGDEDLYVISGNIPGVSNIIKTEHQPNALLRNDGDGTFSNVSRLSGADHGGSGRGGGYLDINDDGCLDIVVANFNAPPLLLKNNCDYGNHWLKINLVGSVSNRDAVGAKITLKVNGQQQVRHLNAGSGLLGQSSLTAHFGLGETSEVDLLRIRWPNGKTEELSNISSNQTLVIRESD